MPCIIMIRFTGHKYSQTHCTALILNYFSLLSARLYRKRLCGREEYKTLHSVKIVMILILNVHVREKEENVLLYHFDSWTRLNEKKSGPT